MQHRVRSIAMFAQIDLYCRHIVEIVFQRKLSIRPSRRQADLDRQLALDHASFPGKLDGRESVFARDRRRADIVDLDDAHIIDCLEPYAVGQDDHRVSQSPTQENVEVKFAHLARRAIGISVIMSEMPRSLRALLRNQEGPTFHTPTSASQPALDVMNVDQAIFAIST